MRRLLPIIALTLFFFLSCSSPSTTASTGSQSVIAPSIEAFFSPRGGATEAVVRELGSAKQEILVQAYSFTSAPIAKALVDAHKRGVKVTVVLDRSQRGELFSTIVQPLKESESENAVNT